MPVGASEVRQIAPPTISGERLVPNSVSKKHDASNSALPRQSKSSFAVVSYFSGCGGLDLGFLGGFMYNQTHVPKMPFTIKAAYDFDSKCVETYRLNIGRHIHQADLASIDPYQVPVADVLIGGFPCQDFSRCGSRKGIAGGRGRLYRAMVKYASVRRPRLVVAENVADMLTLNEGRDFESICKEFRRIGYRSVAWDLKAHKFGVPQKRNRAIVLFVREDLPLDPTQPIPRFENKPRSVHWAIHDLERFSDAARFPNQDQYFKAVRAGRGHGQGDEFSYRFQDRELCPSCNECFDGRRRKN